MSTTTEPATPTVDGPDPIDAATIKADFPLLNSTMAGSGHDRLITYLDSAATSQKPQVVIDAISNYYETTNANVARGVYELAEASTNAMERARRKVAAFIGAPSANEIIFTKNATEGLNLVAHSWGRANLGPGDAVVLTQLEHHANIVPWQILAAERGFEIRWVPVDETGQLDLTDLDRLLDGAKLMGLSAMSNVLGTLTPVRHITDAAHAAGALVSVDACQYVPPPPHRRRRTRRRLPVVLGTQDVRPHRRGRAVGPGRAARCHAAVPRRGRHDRERHAGGLHHRGPAPQVRGRHPTDRRGRGHGRRGRLPQWPRDERSP